MPNPLEWLFSSAGFMPHGSCYLWQPDTLWLNVASDGMIAAAYYAIPVALYYLVRERRREIPYPGVLLMFAAFILLCGTTHIMEIVTVWNPQYRSAGAVKAVTGIVSVATTFALFRIIPQAMLLRSPAQLQREVASRTAELARLNAQLRAEGEARDFAQVQLREQDRRKDEFLAILAHELRNPLAPIRHAAKLLDNPAVKPGQAKWGLAVIDRQAHRMALLLDDLLDVARINTGKLELKKQWVSLSGLVDTAVETVRPVIEERRHQLSVQLPTEPLCLHVDPLRLSQAISNLLMNAAKYTPKGGSIRLGVSSDPSALTIEVSDTGIGFEPAKASELFKMFSQEDSRVEGVEGGLGIGLSLAASLIELHGGSLRAESAGRDMGAKFIITLGAAQLAATRSA